MRVYRNGVKIELAAQDYVGAGGEGTIYARGGTAYKIYHDPTRVLPQGKLQELARIADPRIVRPEALLTDGNGRPVGYAARFVKGAFALCQLFPRSFRDRNGVSGEAMARLIARLREGVELVHRAGVLIVDLNEMNFLAGARLDEVYFIDADSWQTPHYPATAVMPSVRDWSAAAFSEGSDWFSFGVVSFQMFTGIHPYKGRHPRVAGLEERMRANLSVFNREVRVPAAAYPLDVIPADWRRWYEALFEQGLRCPPPAAPGAAVAVAPAPRPIAGTGLFVCEELRAYDAPITGVWLRPHDGLAVVVAGAGVWVGERRVAPAPRGVRGCGFSRGGRPVLVSWEGGVPALLDLEQRREVPLALEAQELACCDGRVYLRSGGRVLEIELHEAGEQLVASLVEVAQVCEHAARLYPGVIVQQLLGTSYVSLLTGPGEARQVRLGELGGRRVVDARYERGVLMVVAEAGGRYDRLVLRFDRADWSHDARTAPDVGPSGLNLVVLDRGVCACLTEEARLELFSARPGSSGLRLLEDPALGGDLILHGRGSVIVARGATLCRLSLKGGG